MKKTQETMVVQNYPMTILRTTTRNHHFRAGESRQGTLTMTEDAGMEVERFEFQESSNETWQRNPLVYRGQLINIHRDKQGLYQVSLHRMTLGRRLSPNKMAEQFKQELDNAKKLFL